MSAAVLARCPNPDVYLHKATRKHLDRNTGRNQSVICSSQHKDPRLYAYGILPMQDLDAQEKSKPGMPIFKRRFQRQHMFESTVGRGLFNPVRACELKAISRDWINYDAGIKKDKTMRSRLESWTKTQQPVLYQHEVGFAKAPCFDPAPYNETGFPMNPRMVSTSSAVKTGFVNTRVFTQPFNIPNEMQHAVGLGAHEEDSYLSKSQHGFGDTQAAMPYIEFITEPKIPRGVTEEKPNFATALLPPPRFIQTASVMSPRKRKELIAVHDEDGDGQMDSEELAAAPTHVRQFMAKNKIGPASPATKDLSRGALTFTGEGPMITPRRSHLLAHDRTRFSAREAKAWRMQRPSSNLATEALRARSGAMTERPMTTTDILHTTVPSGSLTTRPMEEASPVLKEAFLDKLVEECTQSNRTPRTDLFAHLSG